MGSYLVTSDRSSGMETVLFHRERRFNTGALRSVESRRVLVAAIVSCAIYSYLSASTIALFNATEHGYQAANKEMTMTAGMSDKDHRVGNR